MMLSPSALTAAATSGACSGGAPGFHQRNTRESRVKGITPGPLSAQPTTATIPGALRHSSAGFNRHRFPSAFAWCDLNRCQVCVARFHRRLFLRPLCTCDAGLSTFRQFTFSENSLNYAWFFYSTFRKSQIAVDYACRICERDDCGCCLTVGFYVSSSVKLI